MKIAFFTPCFPKLSETFVLEQITGMIDLGHEVHIYAQQDPAENKIHEAVSTYGLLRHAIYYRTPFFVVAKLFSRLLSFLHLSRSFLRIGSSKKTDLGRSCALKTKHYDVILCHFGPSGYEALFLKDRGLIQGKICVFLCMALT